MINNNKGQGAGLAWGVFAFIAFTITIIVLIVGFDTIDASHLGVKIKFGEITGVMEPGMQWTGLFTHVEEYDMRIRKSTVIMEGVNSATDSSGQAVFGSVNVNYRVKNNKDVVWNLYKNVGPDSVIEDRLNLGPIIREGFKQATVKYEAMDILNKRQEVKELAIKNIQGNFPAEYFEIVDIVVENIDFTPEFKLAIEQKKIATQNKLKEEEQVQVVIFQQQQEIERFKADAEKMRLQKAEITELLVQQQMIIKWDGHLPQYLIMPPEGGGMLMQLAKGESLSVK